MSRLIIAAVSLAALGLVSGAPVARADDAGEAVFKKNCFICHTVEMTFAGLKDADDRKALIAFLKNQHP